MKCLYSAQGDDGWARAKHIVHQLGEHAVIGNRLAVQIMQLDVLLADVPVRHDRVNAILNRIARSVVLTEETFKM